MHFALIGDDPDVFPILRGIASHADHQLTHVAHAETTLPEVLQLFPASATSSWEKLLLADSIDAVIVAGHKPTVLLAAKQLMTAGKDLLVFCRASQGIAFVYELTLIRDDSNSKLVPIFPHCGDPFVKKLWDQIESGQMGTLSHLELEREIKMPSAAATGLSVNEIDEALLADVDLIRMLAGHYNQITALRSADAADCVSLATVTLAGDGLPEFSWTARAVSQKSSRGSSAESSWKLTVTGTVKTAILSKRTPRLIFEPTNNVTETPAEFSATTSDWGTQWLQQFESAFEEDAIRPDWTDVTRDFEIVEATHRSVARRRTIDLHFETTSERAIFKSQMTAIGCALLTLILISLLGLLVVGAMLDNRSPLEANAASAGFIVYRTDFVGQTTRLTNEAATRISLMAPRMKTVAFSVLVEETESVSNYQLGEKRRQAVAAALSESGALDTDRRTILRRVHGRTANLMMKVLRTAWSIPLILFLLLQLLIFVTRPSRERQPPTE